MLTVIVLATLSLMHKYCLVYMLQLYYLVACGQQSPVTYALENIWMCIVLSFGGHT